MACRYFRLYRATFRTKSDFVFSRLHEKWYPEGKKAVPKDLQLDPLAIAIWYCDDGSNYLVKRTCKFATYGFDRVDCEFLVDLLSQHGVACYIDKQNVILVRASHHDSLLDMVAPFVKWKCFEHKIRRKVPKKDLTKREEKLNLGSLSLSSRPLGEGDSHVARFTRAGRILEKPQNRR